MLEFTKRKFLSLPVLSQQKKPGDILKKIILFYPDNWKSLIKEYNNLVTWLEADDKILPDNAINTSQFLEYYHYWMKRAGIGPESTLLNKFTFADLQTPKAASINWSVLLHNIRSGYNVGSAIRTVDCFGLASVNISGYTPGTDNKSVISSAMGAEKWVPFFRWESPFKCVENLDPDTVVVALETNPEAVLINDFCWPEKGIIIVGNEELGIPDELMDRAKHTVYIPVYGRKASLNLSNALSIALFHLRSYFEKV